MISMVAGLNWPADGSRPSIERPENFAVFLEHEMAKWEKGVKSAGIRPH